MKYLPYSPDFLSSIKEQGKEEFLDDTRQKGSQSIWASKCKNKIRDKVSYSQSWLNAIWVEIEEWKQQLGQEISLIPKLSAELFPELSVF